MNIRTLIAAVASASILPMVASAQSADEKYCSALSDSYDHYVLSAGGSRGNRSPPANIANAMAKCSTDPATSIPVLEKALKDQQMPLPPRG